jgi:hypothetical protein
MFAYTRVSTFKTEEATCLNQETIILSTNESGQSPFRMIQGVIFSPELFIKSVAKFISTTNLYLIGNIFYPPGEPISHQSLRYSPFEVVHYIFRGHCLDFAAISARE